MEIISKNTSNLNVKKAELAGNNLPFSLMDKLIPLCKNIFKDSKVAAAKELRLEDSRR